MSKQKAKDKYSLQARFEPLFEAIAKAKNKPELADRGRDILALEGEGMLAWGVKSGYLLWNSQNPGALPTMEQIAVWYVVGQLKQPKTRATSS